MNLDPADKECSISHTFRHVYRFILEAMKGDTAAASAIFEKYLGGELPEELISLSRCHVQENQNQSRGTGGAAVWLANGSGKERKPPPDDPYGNFLGDCYG